jgi:hypothetical protein
MPTLTDNPLEEVKLGLQDQWAPLPEGKTEDEDRVPIGDLKAVRTEEPKQAPDLPLLSMQTRGFRRGSLTDAVVEGPIRDPLGGRRWVWRLDVRVWVAIASDEVAAQRTLDALIPQVVNALEEDPTLGGVADNAVISAGNAVIVNPKAGNPMLMLTCDCAVETEEPLT